MPTFKINKAAGVINFSSDMANRVMRIRICFRWNKKGDVSK